MVARQDRRKRRAVRHAAAAPLNNRLRPGLALAILRFLPALGARAQRVTLGGDQEAVDAGALELGARSLALLSAGERANPHAIERSHIAHHGLIDLGLACPQRVGVFALDARRKGLRLSLGPHHANLDAEAAFGLGWRRALPRRTGAASHVSLARPRACFSAGGRGRWGWGMHLRRGLNRGGGRRLRSPWWARGGGGGGAAKPAGKGI